MNVRDFLSPADTIVERRTLDKLQLLKELSARAAANCRLDGGSVTEAILKREDLGSTGIGAGVAIPHARFSELRKSFGVLVRLKKPMDFDAVDGNPVDVVFLLLAPESDQLNALACVARSLRNPEVVAALRRTKDGAAAYQVVVRSSTTQKTTSA
jgi:nitrogen PTS system EIIA component